MVRYVQGEEGSSRREVDGSRLKAIMDLRALVAGRKMDGYVEGYVCVCT